MSWLLHVGYFQVSSRLYEIFDSMVAFVNNIA